MAASNRATQLFQNWAQKQQMLEEVFGKGAAGELIRQQYDFFRQGSYRISADATPDEKLVLALIDKKAAKLERQVYPNLLVRGIQRIKAWVYDRPKQVARFKKLKAQNLESLKERLSALGFSGQSLKLEDRLDFERQKVSLDLVTSYGSGGQLDVSLHLEKDSSGAYQLQEYTASLKGAQNPELNRSFTFDPTMDITAREAANLLEGRAVMKREDSGTTGSWLQLDFIARDGRPQLKELSAEGAFNLREEMIKVAKVLNQHELYGPRVMKWIGQGHQVAVSLVGGKVSYLEADPMGKTILIRNERKQVVSLEKLKKQQEISIKPDKHMANVKKLELDKGGRKSQGQSLGIA